MQVERIRELLAVDPPKPRALSKIGFVQYLVILSDVNVDDVVVNDYGDFRILLTQEIVN